MSNPSDIQLTNLPNTHPPIHAHPPAPIPFHTQNAFIPSATTESGNVTDSHQDQADCVRGTEPSFTNAPITSSVTSACTRSTPGPPSPSSSSPDRGEPSTVNFHPFFSNIKSYVLLLFLILFIVLLVTRAVHFNVLKDVEDAYSSVAKQNRIASRVRLLRLDTDLSDMESSVRGFIITGDDTYLKRYQVAQPRYKGHIEKLRNTLAGPEIDPSIRERVFSIAADYITSLSHMMDTRRLYGFEAARQEFLVSNSEAKMLEFDHYKDLLLREIRDWDFKLMDDTQHQFRISWITDVLGVVLGFIAFALCFVIAYYFFDERALARNVTLQELLRKAEASTKTKNEFIKNLSHELLTPMNGVLLSARQLSRTLLTMDQWDIASELLLSAEYLNDMLKDLLLASQLFTERFHCPCTPFSIDELLHEIDEEMQSKRLIGRKARLQWSISFEADVPNYVKASKKCIKLILSQFLSNSCKFTEYGSIVLTVRHHRPTSSSTTTTTSSLHPPISTSTSMMSTTTSMTLPLASRLNLDSIRRVGASSFNQDVRISINEKETKTFHSIEGEVKEGPASSASSSRSFTFDSGKVDLDWSVSDTGEGIPFDQQARLFEQFQPGDASNTKKFPGTGLGLWVCSQLASQMASGQLSVVSQPGHGSTFTLTTRGAPVCTVGEVLDYERTQEPRRSERDKKVGGATTTPTIPKRFVAESKENLPIQLTTPTSSTTLEQTYSLVDLPPAARIERTPIRTDTIATSLGPSLLDDQPSLLSQTISESTIPTTSMISLQPLTLPSCSKLHITEPESIMAPISSSHALTDSPAPKSSSSLARETLDEPTPPLVHTPSSHMIPGAGSPFITSPSTSSVATSCTSYPSPRSRRRQPFEDSSGGLSAADSPYRSPRRSLSVMGPVGSSHRVSFAASTFQPLRVLVVDDNRVNQKVLARALKSLGHDVVLADGGLEAVEAFQKTDVAFDIILMDIMMPEVDGYEATDRIRKLELERQASISAIDSSDSTVHALIERGGGIIRRTRSEGDIIHQQTNVYRTPIIAVTAAGEQCREQCLAAGMDDYIGKPFTSMTLNKILEAHAHRLKRSTASAPIHHSTTHR